MSKAHCPEALPHAAFLPRNEPLVHNSVIICQLNVILIIYNIPAVDFILKFSDTTMLKYLGLPRRTVHVLPQQQGHWKESSSFLPHRHTGGSVQEVLDANTEADILKAGLRGQGQATKCTSRGLTTGLQEPVREV